MTGAGADASAELRDTLRRRLSEACSEVQAASSELLEVMQ